MKTWLLPWTALCLLGCASQPRQLRDGSYQIDCEETLATCTRKAQLYCRDKGEFQIVHANEENSLVGVEGHQKGHLLSRLVFACGDQTQAKPLKLPPRPEGAVLPEGTPTPAASAERACVPGSTQRCVGVGACEGGQACLADGSGYGPCECAPGEPAPDAG
jgi:hypothetical protein